MIDHMGLTVSDFEKSKHFYAAALAPIGYRIVAEIPAETPQGAHVLGLGEPPHPDFWIVSGKPNEPRIHIGFRVDTRTKVDAFHAAAIEAGGRDNGGPGIRSRYHPNYYAAFVFDPDGHNIEVVCHENL